MGLFKKPDWSVSQSSQPASTKDIFRRTEHSYDTISKEQDARRERNRAKKAAAKAKYNAAAGKRAPKRRRVSDPSDDEGSNDSSTEEERSEVGELQIHEDESKLPTSPGTLRSSRSSNTVSERAPAPSTPVKPIKSRTLASTKVIDLEDGEGGTKAEQLDGGNAEASPASSDIHEIAPPDFKQATNGDSASDSDEEFRELRRRARKRGRCEGTERKLDDQSNTKEPSADKSVTKSQEPDQATKHTRSTANDHDPRVQIFITSPIENTQPLIVQRKMSQQLKAVREAWCNRQGFAQEMQDTVFLTWKGKRLFDVSTCRILGVQVDSNGLLVDQAGSDMYRGDDESHDRHLHMEAMTESTFADMKRRRERASLPQNDDENDDDVVETEVAKPIAPTNVKIIVRAPEMADFRVAVNVTTRVKRIIGAFRTFHNLGPEREVLLQFDGESLDPDTVVSELDLEDMDNIDAYVK